MLYILGAFLIELILATFIGTPNPAWVQSASLHQQSALGMLNHGHVWTQLGSAAFKDCFHFQECQAFISLWKSSVNQMKTGEKKKSFSFEEILKGVNSEIVAVLMWWFIFF